MEKDIIRRKAKNNCYCRGCDKELKRDIDEVIYTYSIRNRGQNIIFCLSCALRIGKLASSLSKEEVDCLLSCYSGGSKFKKCKDKECKASNDL